MALVRDDEVRARHERVREIAAEWIGWRPRCFVTSAATALDVVYEAAGVLLRGRKVQREARLGAREPAMYISMAYRRVAPLVAVLVRTREDGFVHGNSRDQSSRPSSRISGRPRARRHDWLRSATCRGSAR